MFDICEIHGTGEMIDQLVSAQNKKEDKRR